MSMSGWATLGHFGECLAKALPGLVQSSPRWLIASIQPSCGQPVGGPGIAAVSTAWHVRDDALPFAVHVLQLIRCLIWCMATEQHQDSGGVGLSWLISHDWRFLSCQLPGAGAV
jgi:hypothetical protein